MMRRSFGIVLLVLLFLFEGTPSFGVSAELPSTYASWIDTINYYRQASGLNPIVEDKKLSTDVRKHLIYLTMSDPKYFTGKYVNRHYENPASPYYSVIVANNGQELSSTLTDAQSQSVDLWMASPFHAIGFMRQRLTRVGWALAYDPTTGFYDSGADLLEGPKPLKAKVITFPGKGSFSRMDTYRGESPDARDSCGVRGRTFTGMPIWVSLTSSPPRKMSATLVTPDGKTLSSPAQICIVNEFNIKTTDPVYGSMGKTIITTNHMVLMIPKDPLMAGVHKVSLSLNGRPKIAWSFTEIAQPAGISLAETSDPTSLSWDAPLSSPTNPTVGYDVLVADSTFKGIKTFSTPTNTFSTTGLSAGNYWVCVETVGKFRTGACPNYVGYTAGSKPLG